MAKEKLPKSPLTRIAETQFERGFKLAKLTASLGVKALANRVAGRSALQGSGAEQIAETLGELRGAAMKFGQLLSIQGADFLPPEVIEKLKPLQRQAEPLAFNALEKVLIQELGTRYSSGEIAVEHTPLASASIGQVHRAKIQGDSRPLVMKIQYPGVAESIRSDVRALRRVVTLSGLLPRADAMDEVMEEIQHVLLEEADYRREARELAKFRELFQADARLRDRVILPEAVESCSTARVLTMVEISGGREIEEFADSASQDARNRVGSLAYEILMAELFKWGRCQTDPNFANFQVMEPDRLILFDYGSVKVLSDEFNRHYRSLIRAVIERNRAKFRQAAIEIGFLDGSESTDISDELYALVDLSMEPIRAPGDYAFGESGLALKLREYLPKFVVKMKFRPPPREIVFINRKIGGVFQLLERMKARVPARALLDEVL